MPANVVEVLSAPTRSVPDCGPPELKVLLPMLPVLAFWRIGADLNLTGSFAIPSGLFSHWQVWMGAAALLQLCASVLNRYGRDTSGSGAVPS